MTNPTMDDLCKVYVRIRAKKHEVQKEMDVKIAEFDEKLKLVALTMKDILVETGAKSVRTDHGTAYITPKTRYYPMDWHAFGQWVVENQAIDLLEKRVAQRNMGEWVEANPTNIPPGMQAETELTVTVRKT